LVKTLVVGTGNLLLSDDGLGIHAIRRLQEVAQLPEEVQILDGGTLGLDLLHYLEGVSHLLIVDALETGQPSGAITRLSGEEVPAYFALKMSPHEIGLPDMLFAAKLRDLYPPEVVIWGAQPGTVEVGLDLSPPVADQVDVLVSNVLGELRRWGIESR
jgi:hydrogenase maturation protease